MGLLLPLTNRVVVIDASIGSTPTDRKIMRAAEAGVLLLEVRVFVLMDVVHAVPTSCFGIMVFSTLLAAGAASIIC